MSSSDNYYNSKKFKHILTEYEESEKTGHPVFLDSEEFTDIAEYYHMHGQLQKAINVIDYAISIYPGAVAPLIFKARMALLKEGNAEKAREIAAEIDDKTDLDYYYIQAEIMIVEQQEDEADDYLKACYHQIDEEDEQDYVLDVATLFADYDLIDKADEWLQRYNDDSQADYRELLGRILLGKGKYAESEKVFNELIDENPFSSHYWNYLASSQLMANRIHDSIESSEYSIAINPDNEEALLNKANGLYSLGNYEEALEYYRRYTQICPSDETGEMFQGVCLLCLNQLEEAVEHLKNAEKTAPPNSPNLHEIYQELAFTLSRLGFLDAALSYVDKTDQLDCDHNEMMVLRGHLLLEHGQLAEAQTCFGYAVKESGGSPHIFLRIAISVFDNGYLQLAYKMLSILKKSSGNKLQEGYSYLAACCKELGKQNEYMENLRLACHHSPAEARNVLGDYFPEELPPEEYYDYEKRKSKKQ